jgi:hypothetical protein
MAKTVFGLCKKELKPCFSSTFLNKQNPTKRDITPRSGEFSAGQNPLRRDISRAYGKILEKFNNGGKRSKKGRNVYKTRT